MYASVFKKICGVSKIRSFNNRTQSIVMFDEKTMKHYKQKQSEARKKYKGCVPPQRREKKYLIYKARDEQSHYIIVNGRKIYV
jgi:hypothetical protein